VGLGIFGCSVAHAGNFFEFPREPNAKLPWLGWVVTSNDGFGHNFGTDEDTLRTFGIHLGFAFLDRFVLSFELQSLTDRNTTLAQSKRIDEIKSFFGGRFLLLRRPDVFLGMTGGIGAFFYGDFGSLGIQEAVHDKEARPVPRNYDASSAHGMAFLYTELYFPKLFLNLHLYAHLTHTLDANIDLTAAYWVIKPMTQYKFSLGYRWNHVTHAGSAAQNVYERENGLYLSAKLMIGPIVLERGFNLFSLVQYAYVGFRIHDYQEHHNRTRHFRMTYSLGWPIGHNSWIEFFRIHPFKQASRVSFFLRTYHTENRIENQQTKRLDDRRIRRIKEVSLGAEMYLFDPDEPYLFNGFVFAGAGFSREMLTSYDQLESRFLQIDTFPLVHAGLGIRLNIPDFIFKEKGRFVGAEIRVNYRYSFGNAVVYSNPNLLLSWGLVFSER
jgi:hypothetical protein